MAKKWGKEEDAKLAALFSKKPSRGGVSTKDLSKPAIEKVRNEHFKDRSYTAFSTLYRKKARQWNLNQSLTGARGKQMKNQCMIGCFYCSHQLIFSCSATSN